MQLPSIIPNWTRVYTGKVHDVYQPVHTLAHTAGDTVILVASDRIAVLDRVLPSVIPGKGQVLTAIAAWWFDKLEDVVPNHFLSTDVPDEVAGRAMLVQRLRMYPIECTVVGYMTVGAFEEYSGARTVGGQDVPKGLKVGDPLPEPLFVPSRKGEAGHDDETISFTEMCDMVGHEQAEQLRDISLQLYERAFEIAKARGLIIAECKLEFGASYDSGDSEFVLGDQAFTPDSATYWLESEAKEGLPRAFGKEYVRNAVRKRAAEWIKGHGPAPILAADVVEEMGSRYRLVEKMLLGEDPTEEEEG